MAILSVRDAGNIMRRANTNMAIRPITSPSPRMLPNAGGFDPEELKRKAAGIFSAPQPPIQMPQTAYQQPMGLTNGYRPGSAGVLQPPGVTMPLGLLYPKLRWR